MGIDTVYVDGLAVSKSAVRSDDKTGKRRNVGDIATVRSGDFTGQSAGLYIREVQESYDLDTSDTATPDDGENCIVDAAGNRFKRVVFAPPGGAYNAYPSVDPSGAVDATTEIQSTLDGLSAGRGGIVHLPPGIVKLNGVNIANGGIRIKGCGWEDFKAPQGSSTPLPPEQGTCGTYILTTNNTKNAFNILGTATHVRISDVAFTQVQPPDAPGWAPTAYPASIACLGSPASNTSTGAFTGENLLFRGVFKGIQAGTFSGSTSSYIGRLVLRDVYGTCFNTAIQIDAASDVCVIDHVHIWPIFYTDPNSPNIYSYVQNGLTSGFQFGRVDNPQLSNIFIYGVRYGMRFFSNTGNPFDVLANGQLNNIGFDSCKVGLDIEASNVNFNISNWYHASPGVAPFTAGDVAISQGGSTSGVVIMATNTTLSAYNGSAVANISSGTGNDYSFVNTKVIAYNQANNGSAAFVALNAGNTITMGGRSLLIAGNGGPLTAGSGTFNTSHIN